MPGLKAKSARKPPAQQQPRKQRRHGFARPRMTPTHRVEHVMENCPDCGAHRSGGWTQRTREVIELPVVPVQVTEHVYIARTCPACRRRCTPPAVLDGVVLGQQHLGVNLLSLIATLREEGRRQSTSSMSQPKPATITNPGKGVLPNWPGSGSSQAICRPFVADPSAVQGKLCRRIERHIKEPFVFVAEPDVPADNNPAERSLRHLVISRKVSGGTRSEQGTESKMTLASIFGTWRAQGLNPLAACRQLLVSPRL